jgi:hypothetical protein
MAVPPSRATGAAPVLLVLPVQSCALRRQQRVAYRVLRRQREGRPCTVAQLHSQTPDPYTNYIRLKCSLYVLLSNFLRNSGLRVHCASWRQKCKRNRPLRPLHIPGGLHSSVQRRAPPHSAGRSQWYLATGSLAHLHTRARQNPSVDGPASPRRSLLSQ